jgi:hypothetical protein
LFLDGGGGGFFGKGALAKGEAALWGQLFGKGIFAKGFTAT